MEEQNKLSTEKISQPVRWLAWLLLGALSVFFAEVSGASSPLVFFDFSGLLITVPLYTLHILVLAPLVIRRGVRTSLGSLFLAGALFGLYEAYITKVLWSPPWNAEAWHIGGVAVLETLVLVLFWHPFLAFIVPLFVGDGLMGGRQTFPRWLQTGLFQRIRPRWLLAAAGGLLGLIHGASIGSLGSALLSSISTTLLLFLLLTLWERAGKGKLYQLVDLLPNRKEWIVLALLLLADYISLSIVLRREAFPNLIGHLSIWGLYLFFGGLLWLSRRIDQKSGSTQAAEAVSQNTPALIFTRLNWIWFSLGFIVLSAIASVLLGWAKDSISLVVWIFAIPLGLYTLGRTILGMVKNRDKIR